MVMNGRGVLVFLLVLFMGLNVHAQDIPKFMNYQGNVTDASGVPINGEGFFKFAIVNDAGDTAYWVNAGTKMDGTEPDGDAVTIPVTDGRFVVKLGDTNLANMVELDFSIFENTNIYLRVWFSVEGTIFEQFTPDTQILATGFAFKAQVANEVSSSSITSTSIQDDSITDADISSSAAISASKIDSTGLDADTLDGNDSSVFQNRVTGTCTGQVMVGIDSDGSVSCESDDVGAGGGDADTLDGKDSTAFATSSHTHVSGIEIVSGSGSRQVFGAVNTATVVCPGDKIVLSGGWTSMWEGRPSPPSASPDISVSKSFPSSASSWNVVFWNNSDVSDDPVIVTAWAICANI